MKNTIEQFNEDMKIGFAMSTLLDNYKELLELFANQFKPPSIYLYNKGRIYRLKETFRGRNRGRE